MKHIRLIMAIHQAKQVLEKSKIQLRFMYIPKVDQQLSMLFMVQQVNMVLGHRDQYIIEFQRGFRQV